MKNQLFVVLSITTILLSPWIWRFTRVQYDNSSYNLILAAIFALCVGFLFLKLNGKQVHYLTIILLVVPLSIELMWFVLFLVHHANNDIHVTASNLQSPEMYRDFNSFFEFSYRNDNWIFRLVRIVKETVIWLFISVCFILIKKKMLGNDNKK